MASTTLHHYTQSSQHLLLAWHCFPTGQHRLVQLPARLDQLPPDWCPAAVLYLAGKTQHREKVGHSFDQEIVQDLMGHVESQEPCPTQHPYTWETKTHVGNEYHHIQRIQHWHQHTGGQRQTLVSTPPKEYIYAYMYELKLQGIKLVGLAWQQFLVDKEESKEGLCAQRVFMKYWLLVKGSNNDSVNPPKQA